VYVSGRFQIQHFCIISFQQNVPSCVKGNEFIKIHLNNNDKGDEVGHRAEKRTRFLATGYLGYNNEFYSPEQYCINRYTQREFLCTFLILNCTQ